jgi:fructose-1,6-bisphosphatase/inositol monophosphatase family enzyme
MRLLPSLSELMSITRDAVADSGAYQAFRNLDSVETKVDGTPVTAVDHAIQAALFNRLRHYDAELIGEEGSELRGNTRYAFVIDPLDGTGGFIRGLPTSSTVVTLMERLGDDYWYPIMSVIHELRPDGWTWGAEVDCETQVVRSNGTTGLGKVKDLQMPLLVTISTWPNAPFRLEAVAEAISRDGRFRNQTFGSIALGAGLIASGGMHATVFAGSSALETMAMSLIVEGAGGVATDFDGNNLKGYYLEEKDGMFDFRLPRGAIMATNQDVADMLVNIIDEHN